jgi:hypothetical protein
VIERRPGSDRQVRVRYTRALRVVRRAHMFAGLLLYPWILFYGLSGILFNHPNVGEKLTARPLPPPVLAARAGLHPWPPAAVAGDVVAALNLAEGAGAYRLDPGFAARFTGPVVLKAPAAEGQHFVLLDLARGGGVLATRYARPAGPTPTFAARPLGLPRYSLAALEGQLGGLLGAYGLSSPQPLRADPRLLPQLELRLIDREGVRWNATYAVGDGRLTGRRTDQWPGVGVSQLSAMLHTTHHYTRELGSRWFWALFQDLLGVLMVFWAGTGLLMWWQMKATRLAGIASVVAALGVAAAVFYGTTRDITFGRVAQTLGPGE